MASKDDYMDIDVAYLMGLIIGRGTLEFDPQRQIIIQFSYSNLEAMGIDLSFDQETQIRLGLNDIQQRLAELLATDIKIVRHSNSVDLVLVFTRNSMIWRNILLLVNNKTSFRNFEIPQIFFDPDIPTSWKKEFVKGYGDVAGNIRKSNIYADGRYRVRLDVLNYPTNWEMAVRMCHLLQEQLSIPVQLITWGHPNMNREFREHQMNIFAESYEEIGFSFKHKNEILNELAKANIERTPYTPPKECPGMRQIRKKKENDPEENNAEKLDPRLVGMHFDSYWQICKALGCRRRPDTGQGDLDFVDESFEKEDE